jgi:hypothetical protein
MPHRTASGFLRFAAAACLGTASLAALGAAPARAQESQWAISFAAGMGRPTGGAFSAEWESGATVLLTVAQQTSSHLEFGGEFGFVKFEPSGDSVAVPRIAPGIRKWEMWRLRFRARRFFASPEAKLAPFVMAGAGVYPLTISSRDSTGVYKITPTGKGVSIGGGIDFRMGESVHFGLEGQYHYITVNQAEVGYKAAPVLDVLLAIRWRPGVGGPE